MRGDFSRQTFTRAKHYAGVLVQQGRVSVDADLNEQQAIVRHRTETEAVDVIGGCGTPLDPPAYADASGFKIQIATSQTSITIGAGRYYVDGILAENEKTADYLEQDLPPYEFPAPPPIPGLLPGAKELGLVYLDVWHRQVTPLEDPRIQEQALGEADTAMRARTAWQVRVLPLPGVAAPVACNAVLAPWTALTAPSTGTLAAITHPPATAPNPCEPPPSAGFTRLENQLYRVEIHRGGANPTFTWSRENGSILTDVRSFATGNWITVGSMGRDAELGFAKDQWVELVDDVGELNADGTVRGQLTRIADVEPASRAIKLADAPASTNLARHPRLRRWDMVTHGPPNAVAVTTDGIAIAAGTEQPLEDGISVEFSAGTYHDGDYWLIPARTASADIEWPRDGAGVAIPQPPAGIRHHYCRLGFIQADAGKLSLLTDCRRKFPPLTELTSFFYVGGDGQEVMPDPSLPTSATPVALPEPLQVGVADGAHPVQGAVVRFQVANPAPAGTVNGKTDFDEVLTDVHGIATCTWAIASNQAKQQVRATLRVNGADSHLPIIFSAQRSRADEVRYFPPAGCATLQPAHDVQKAIDRLGELVHLSYVSGDAQEVRPPERTSLQPLGVRVWSACGPIAGATVAFKVLTGGGAITPTAVTDASGLASADWDLGPAEEHQGALAALTAAGPNAGADASIHSATSTVAFSAKLELGQGPPQQEVVVIVEVQRGDGKDLVNNDDVALAELLPGGPANTAPGIVIRLDHDIDADTVIGKATIPGDDRPNSHPACFVSVELPWPASPQDVDFWGVDSPLIGFETIVLAAELRVEGNVIVWAPSEPTRRWLLTRMLQVNLKGRARRVLAHLTLKGAFIRGKERHFLDGEPFGPRSSVNFNETSGDDAAGGDFELWFWLVQEG
ncbi:MAG TPA: DUF6519 domain-containing protein [Conexibacter sp.]|jgi:hypothetical protein